MDNVFCVLGGDFVAGTIILRYRDYRTKFRWLNLLSLSESDNDSDSNSVRPSEPAGE